MMFKRLRAKLYRQWRRRGTGPGLLYSLLLHAAALALILLWPRVENTPAPRMVALIIDLVDAPSSGSPASGKDAAETGASAAPAAAPTPATPAPPRKEAPSVPPAPKGEEPRPSQPAAHQEAAPSVGDLLRGAEAAHGDAAAATPGSGGSGFADAVDAGGTGAASLKDFIRVQIERRWQVDPNAPNTQVSLRIVIAADGSVTAAEPLNDGGQDRTLRALAIGARNAALLSSPLQFPRGTFAITGEMIIDLNTRDARR